MRTKSFIAVPLILMVLSSCQNKSESAADPAWFLDGVGYSSLQDAFDAAAAMGVDNGMNVITLSRSASGPGAKMKDGCDDYFEINLGRYTYTLKNGSIDANSASLYVNGDGGKIVSKSKALSAVAGAGDFLFFYNNASIDASRAIESSADVFFDTSFEGSVNGNIYLSDGELVVESSKCMFRVPLLDVNGSNNPAANFCVSNGTSEEVAVIDMVQSDLKYPVCADNESNIKVKTGDAVHVHHFSQKITHAATCTHEAYEVTSCPECGKTVTEILSSDFGPCPAEDLVHHVATEAGLFSNGNIEYWSCPHCGKEYLDPNGKNQLQESHVILANSYKVSDELLTPIPDLSWQDLINAGGTETKAARAGMPAAPADISASSALSIAGMVVSLIGDGITVAQIIEGDTAEARLTDKLNTIVSKIDELQSTTNTILATLEEFMRQTKYDHYNEQVVEYNKTINRLLEESCLRLVDYSAEDATLETRAALVKKWATERNLEDLRSVLVDFKTFKDGKPYINTMYEMIKLCRFWEHDVYEWMAQQTASAFLSLFPSVIMAEIYYSEFADPIDKSMNKRRLEETSNLFNYVYKTYQSTLKAIQHRDNLYRINMMDDQWQYLRLAVGPTDFGGWIEEHKDLSFSRKYSEKETTTNLGNMLKSGGYGDSCFRKEDFQLMKEKDNDFSKCSIILQNQSYLTKYAKFDFRANGQPVSLSEIHIFYYTKPTYVNDNLKCIATYGIASFSSTDQSYGNYRDYFAIENLNSIPVKVVENCKIVTNGKITSLGEVNHYKWYTIKRVSRSTVPGFVAEVTQDIEQ